ncbi:USP6 N-terminal-like protein [Bagarius yarrelli]|uniref:USP6 N-terminal-like protein n=1 Tax=Bagarius yarrelli TaxID=175774 RepID=A0A556TH38_BAGYA|nr:USP6 N-terminal-like protein [Bagarius yarrelli]
MSSGVKPAPKKSAMLIDASEHTQKLKMRARELSPDIRQIDLDVNRTYRDHIMFMRRYDVKQQDLFHVLTAYSMYNSNAVTTSTAIKQCVCVCVCVCPETLMKFPMEDLVEFLQVSLSKDFFFDDDFVIEQLQSSMSELRRSKLELPPPGNNDEFPTKPLGQLPPEPKGLAPEKANHIANGRMEAPPTPISANGENKDSPVKTPRKAEKEEGSYEATPTESGSTHVLLNQNLHVGPGGRKEIGPRWVKPSEGKLAAMMEGHIIPNNTVPSSPAMSMASEKLHHRRPHSRGFVPGADRGSNASQYDNVPVSDGEAADVPFFTAVSEPSHQYMAPSAKHGSPTRPPSGGITAPTFRIPKNPPVHLMPDLRQPLHYSPGMMPAYSPYSPKLQPGNRAYRMAYDERAYGTTVRTTPPNRSPDRALMNNSYTTYRREPINVDFVGQMDGLVESGHLPRQPTRLDQRYERQWQGQGRHGEMDGDLASRRTPAGLPRSSSFQRAQILPVNPGQEFSFPPMAVSENVMQYRAMSNRNQMPTVFGGVHYRQEAFAMQESMLL